jgi:hypothetical protein
MAYVIIKQLHGKAVILSVTTSPLTKLDVQQNTLRDNALMPVDFLAVNVGSVVQ